MDELRIRLERESREYTQEYVGEIVGVSGGAIHFIETGQRKPSYDVLCKLEKLFGMKHEELFEPVAGTIKEETA